MDGVFSDFPEAAFEKEPEVDPFYRYIYESYLKIGTFLKISPNEFLDVTWDQIEYTSRDIDKRLEPYQKIDTENSSKSEPFLSYEYLYICLALAKLFGSTDEEE